MEAYDLMYLTKIQIIDKETIELNLKKRKLQKMLFIILFANVFFIDLKEIVPDIETNNVNTVQFNPG
jgi:hypothetical protein